MASTSLLKIYFIGTAVSALVALFGLVDSVGGLMFAPTHYTGEKCTVGDFSTIQTRSSPKKHIGLR